MSSGGPTTIAGRAARRAAAMALADPGTRKAGGAGGVSGGVFATPPPPAGSGRGTARGGLGAAAQEAAQAEMLRKKWLASQPSGAGAAAGFGVILPGYGSGASQAPPPDANLNLLTPEQEAAQKKAGMSLEDTDTGAAGGAGAETPRGFPSTGAMFPPPSAAAPKFGTGAASGGGGGGAGAAASSAADMRRAFRVIYEGVPDIRILERFLALADTLHDFIRGFRNKLKGRSAEFVEEFINSFLTIGPGRTLPEYIKTFIRTKKHDIEDATVEHFETKANLPFIGPRDMNASETHDELISKCPTPEAAEEYGKQKRIEFDSYELKPGATEIKAMSVLQKTIILAFSVTFLFGAKDIPAFFFVDGPAKRVRLLLQLSEIIRGLFMPQTIGDSAATTFKPLTKAENLYASPANRDDGSFMPDENYFTKGLYLLGYKPIEGQAFTDKSRFAWKYVIDGRPSGHGVVEIQYGGLGGAQPSEGPSVDQLLQLQTDICANVQPFRATVDKPSQLNITNFLIEGGADGIVADLRELAKLGISLLFDIKEGGDYHQVCAGDLLAILLTYVGMISPDRLAILKARMMGLPAWQHNGDHFKLFKTRLREEQLSPEKLAEFKRNKTVRELRRSLHTVQFFCNSANRAGLLTLYGNLTSKVGPNIYLDSKITDIQVYVNFILFYSVTHRWCVQAAYDDSYNDLQLYNAVQVTSRILSEITRNIDIYRKIINGYIIDIDTILGSIFAKVDGTRIIAEIKSKVAETKGINIDAIYTIIDSVSINPAIFSSIIPAARDTTLTSVATAIRDMWTVTSKHGVGNADIDGRAVFGIVNTALEGVDAIGKINAAIRYVEETLRPILNSVTYNVLIPLLKTSLIGNIISNSVDTPCIDIITKMGAFTSEQQNATYSVAASVLDEYIGVNIMRDIDSANSRVIEFISPYSSNFLHDLISLSGKDFKPDNIHNELNYSPVRAKELNDQFGVICANIIAIVNNPDRFPLVDLINQIDKYNSLLIAFCNSFYDQSVAGLFYQNNCITVNFAGADRRAVPYNIQLDGEDDDEGEAVVVDNSIVLVDRNAIKTEFNTAVSKRRDPTAKGAYRRLLMGIITMTDLPVTAGPAAHAAVATARGGAVAGGGAGGQGGGSREGAERRSPPFIQYGGDYEDDEDKTYDEVVEDFLYEVSIIVNEFMSRAHPELTTYSRILQLSSLTANDSNRRFIESETIAIVTDLKRMHGDQGNEISKYTGYISADIPRILHELHSGLEARSNIPQDDTILSLYNDKLSTYYNKRGEAAMLAALAGTGDGIYKPHPLEDKINGFMLGESAIDICSGTAITYVDSTNKSVGFLTRMTMKKAISLTILYDIITYIRNKVSIFTLFFPTIDKYGSYVTRTARYTLPNLFDSGKGQNLLLNLTALPLTGIESWISSAEFRKLHSGGARRRTRRRYSRRRYNRSRKQKRVTRKLKRQPLTE